MTTFTEPLKVKRLDADTTVAHISAQATQFQGPFSVTTSAGTTALQVDTSGRLSVGTVDPGRVMEVQRSSVNHTASAAVSIAHVPACDITNIEILYNATMNASADTLDGTVHLGVSGDDERLGAIGLSANSVYSIHDHVVSAASLVGVSGTITAKVTGAGSAANPNGGSFRTYVHYIRN